MGSRLEGFDHDVGVGVGAGAGVASRESVVWVITTISSHEEFPLTWSFAVKRQPGSNKNSVQLACGFARKGRHEARERTFRADPRASRAAGIKGPLK